jgi:WD40-like Beta Propeller Repeat
MRTNFHPCLALLFLLVAGVSPLTANGQLSFPVKREFTWSLPGSEIRTPQFSLDGNFIVLVSRVHVADGGEAEGLPESYFNALKERQQKDPRFADPIIKLIDLQGKTVCEVSYGWNPSISPDNKSLVYSRQKRAITGLRELAETQDGNDIQLFDCEKKEGRLVAEPDTGYLDDPFFFSDGNSIVFSENEAVNGAFGGAVGIGRFDLQLNHKSTLLSKKTGPAIPCPPGTSSKQTRDSFMCSQITNPTSSFPQLLMQVAPADKQLFVLLGIPIPSPDDTYMASTYDIHLVSLLPETNEILSLGKTDMANSDEPTLQSVSDRRVMIFSQYWRLFSLTTGKWLTAVGPRNTRRRSVYSPDLKYYLTVEPSDDPSHFVLRQTIDGKKLATFPKTVNADVLDAVWSRGSKRFAIVGVSNGSADSTYREELIVYSMP